MTFLRQVCPMFQCNMHSRQQTPMFRPCLGCHVLKDLKASTSRNCPLQKMNTFPMSTMGDSLYVNHLIIYLRLENWQFRCTFSYGILEAGMPHVQESMFLHILMQHAFKEWKLYMASMHWLMALVNRGPDQPTQAGRHWAMELIVIYTLHLLLLFIHMQRGNQNISCHDKLYETK